MKQKNLVLMVVAVGCGLAAAFLTSTMTGRQRTPDLELVEILVAAKSLDPGTKFTKDSMKDLVKTKKVPKGEEPQNAASKPEDLLDKQLLKALRPDDHIGTADLGIWEGIQAPAGYDLITVRVSIEYMTPFVKPTSKVDLLGIVNSRKNVVNGTVLIPSMLVMAVDAQSNPGDGKGAALNYQLVTLAAKPDEALLIRMAERANVQLSFTLLNKDTIATDKKDWTIDKAKKWINDAIMDSQQATAPPTEGPKDQPKETTTAASADPQKAQLKYLVPKENLKPGTDLTADVITDKFEEKAADKVPDGAVTDLKPYLGKYIVKQMWKGEAFKADSLGENPNPKKDEPKKEEPKVVVAPAPAAPPVEDKRKYTEGTKWISNGTVSKQWLVRYYEDGTSKVIREVQPDEDPKLTEPKTEPKKSDAATAAK